MNLCFRGLAYYYTKMNVDFRLNKVMIHFKGFHELQKAVHISKIEDMSYLMIKLMKYNIAEYTEKSLKIIEDGIIIIFERISIQESL